MLTKVIQEELIQQLKKYLDKGQRFVIVSHMSPDGDAIGSSLGLYHFLMASEKEQVSVVVPNDFPAFYQWMPGASDIVVFDRCPEKARKLIQEADVLFCLDLNEPKRMGKLAPVVMEAETRRILIDHHLDPADFCKVIISEPQISSTCELVFRVICRLGRFELVDRKAATCRYTGMMTDTGGFTYNSNKPEIYTIISELIKKGIDKDWIYRQVNQTTTESRMRMMGYVLYEKMKVYPEKHAALITLTQKEMKSFNYKTGDTEGFVNLPLSIGHVQFSAFIRESPEDIRVSLRSVGDFPCNRFASTYFQGGGHKNASGGEFVGTLEEAVALFEKGLAEFDPKNPEKPVNVVNPERK